MYIFESRFKNLMFYYNGKQKKFNGGMFATDDKDIADVLRKCKSAKLIEEPAQRGRPKKED